MSADSRAAAGADPWQSTLRGRPAPGATAERTRRTSARDVAMFAAMTGDRNPLHFDAALAARSPFGGLIVQGGVTSGLLNAIVAEDLPGPGTVFLGVEWRFVKAVPVGEVITGRVEVTAVRDDKPICTIETSVRNARGEICLSGRATTYTVPLAPDAARALGPPAGDGGRGNGGARRRRRAVPVTRAGTAALPFSRPRP